MQNLILHCENEIYNLNIDVKKSHCTVVITIWYYIVVVNFENSYLIDAKGVVNPCKTHPTNSFSDFCLHHGKTNEKPPSSWKGRFTSPTFTGWKKGK